MREAIHHQESRHRPASTEGQANNLLQLVFRLISARRRGMPWSIAIMNLPSPSRLIFIGDSITDAGRDQTSGEPSPWSPNFGLGSGYVSLVWAWLAAAYPQKPIRVFNKGTSGNNARDLDARWETDVTGLDPDVLCVMIGINDVWRQFDVPLRPDHQVAPEEYRAILDRLLGRTRPQIQQLYLASPYYIEPNREEPMRKRMDEYGQIVKDLAEAHDATFIDVQAAFDAVLAHVHPTSLGWDHIHPGMHGHMIIARAFLKAFGCPVP